jgi:hypothetical protein
MRHYGNSFQAVRPLYPTEIDSRAWAAYSLFDLPGKGLRAT